MTVALTAVSAALGLCLALLVTFLALRKRSGGEDRLANAIGQLNTRVDTMLQDVFAARERVEEESRRTRSFAELASSIDLDEVLSRTLEAAGALRGVDAALVRMAGPDQKPTVATLGLSPEETDGQVFAQTREPERARAVRVSYEYPPEELEASASALHSAVGVPLRSEAGAMGVLTIFTRSPLHAFGEEDVRSLEELALRAGPAIENAARFREARQLADLDALTGLHNRRYFHDTLAREVSRAQRYERQLGLIVFDLDDFKAINDHIGHLAGDAVLAEAAERIRAVVRSADIACRVGGDEFSVILPESSAEDADQLYRRLQQSVLARPTAQADALFFSAGVAEFRPDDDAISFFQRADDALYRAKELGKGQVVSANH